MLFNYNTIVTDLHIVIFLKIFYLNLGIVRYFNLICISKQQKL
jgi:hypothetical protein